ncbi:MAG: 30S ribosomal protein S3ae [Methanolinea sp.]|nr:30S ribosomal protein S3ae [Methanolinea sp.]
MAKKKQSGRRVEGWKAKSWYKVFAPEVLGKTYIGDTIANDPESVVGRILQTTLGEIINDYARQNVKMKFKIANVAGDSAYTEFVGHEIARDYLRSMIKRRTSRIDCHVPVTTKDGKRVDLTVTCFTLTRANLSQAHEIRSIISSMIAKMGSEADMNGIISGIVNGDFSREVFKAVKPVFPVRRVEVIKSKLTTAKVV